MQHITTVHIDFAYIVILPPLPRKNSQHMFHPPHAPANATSSLKSPSLIATI
jgi:hypothetical protein